jgi:hypothetical protein
MSHGFHHSRHWSRYARYFILYAARNYATATYRTCLESDIARVISSYFCISLHAAITDKCVSSNRQNVTVEGMSVVADVDAGIMFQCGEVAVCSGENDSEY